MKESYEQGLASHLGPESYADGGNNMGVALSIGVHAGQPLSSEISNFRVPTWSYYREGNMRHSIIGERCHDAAESETLSMCGNFRRENREVLLVSNGQGGMSPPIGTVIEHPRWYC